MRLSRAAGCRVGNGFCRCPRDPIMVGTLCFADPTDFARMRPSLLAPLFAPARSLKGVGPRIEGLLTKLVAPRHQSAHARVIDLLWHLPQGVIDRQLTPRIADARIGELATLEVTVTEHRPGGPRRGARAPYRVLVEDESGALELVYFNADPAYLKRLLPEGSRKLDLWQARIL